MAIIIELSPAGAIDAELRGLYQPDKVAHVGVIVQGSVDILLIASSL